MKTDQNTEKSITQATLATKKLRTMQTETYQIIFLFIVHEIVIIHLLKIDLSLFFNVLLLACWLDGFFF